MAKRNGGVIDAAKTSAAGRAIFLSSIGEVVEWFDFMVYLSLAPVLARVIFAPDDSSSLMMTGVYLIAAVTFVVCLRLRETFGANVS